MRFGDRLSRLEALRPRRQGEAFAFGEIADMLDDIAARKAARTLADADVEILDLIGELHHAHR